MNGELELAGRHRQNDRAPADPVQLPVPATIDLVELTYRLLGSWKLFCSWLLSCLNSGLYTIYFVTPMYEATSTIYVLSHRDSAINMADLQVGTALTSDYIKVFSNVGSTRGGCFQPGASL